MLSRFKHVSKRCSTMTVETFNRDCGNVLIYQIRISLKREIKTIAEDGFDPSTSGLWAQHASSAPLCLLDHLGLFILTYCIMLGLLMKT